MAINTIKIGNFIDTRTVPTHKPQLAEVTTALEELCVLLEDYSPAWYTEEQRMRALNALLCAHRLAS